MKTAVIILAAGASTRLGEPKQLAEVGGETLLGRALRVSLEAGLEPAVVVLGADATKIQDSCDLSKARVVVNEDWPEGMASSLRKGVEAIADESVDAAVVMTCDMPFVDAEHLRALLLLAEEAKMDTASSYDGRKGVPAVFFRSSFVRLSRLTGDAGARSILMDAPVVVLRYADDVDTPQALLDAQRIARFRS